jgi:hypothetical protein
MAGEDSATIQQTRDQARQKLKSALDAACRADVDQADTGEFIRIEEMLAIATDAARSAVAVRQSRPSTAAELAHPEHREIEDARGIRWLVFAVHPSATRGRVTIREHFRAGWLAFDSGIEPRRLAPIPDGWERMTDPELVALCDRAEAAPRRRKSEPAEVPPPKLDG